MKNPVAKLAALVGACLLVIAALLWHPSGPGLLHDAPRQLPWSVPDYRPAQARHFVLADGRIRIEITHLPLRGPCHERTSSLRACRIRSDTAHGP